MTQEELAKEVGVTQPNVYRWEMDQVTPSIETIKKLAKALNISVDGLLFTEEERRDLKIADKELLEKIKELENLNRKDKEALVRLIDAFRAKAEKK